MLKSGRAKQLGQRYDGGKRYSYGCTAMGSSLFVVGGLESNYEKLVSVEMYDSSTNEWTSMPPLATASSGHTCTAMGSLLFVVGGMDSNAKKLASVEKYDSSTNEWTSMAPLATARSNHSCTAMGSLLFVVGGQGNRER